MDFPGYRVEREIGKGGMASVYLAIQESLHRLVALKVMEPRLAANENFAERFLKEGRIIARLTHSQIVTVYDFGAYKDNYYLSMEYLPGGTLEQKIREGLPLDEIMSIIKVVGKALGYAHSQGVLHRDIKPQNILFRNDGSPVLTDFGIARFVDDSMQLTAPGFTVGSPLYMSPERIMGKKIDARSDLYSLGVVFYQMLTAQLPYQADNSIGVALKQCSAPIPVLPRERSKFQPILEKLLAKDPQDRFTTAGEFIDELSHVETLRAIRYWLPWPRRAAKEDLRKRLNDIPLSYKRWALASILTATVTAGIYLTAMHLVSRESELSFSHYLEPLPSAEAERSPTATRYEELALQHLTEWDLDQSLKLIAIGLRAVPEDKRLLALREQLEGFQQAEDFLNQAKRQKQAGNLPNSLELVKEGLQLAPKHPKLVALHKEIAHQVERREKKVAEYLQQARDYQSDGQLANALSALDQGLALLPDHTASLALRNELKKKQQQALFRILQEVGQYRSSGASEKSLTALQEGLKLAPDHPVLGQLYAQVMTEIEQRNRVKALLEKAQNRYENKAYRECLSLLDEGLKLQPKHPGLLNLRKRATNALAQQEGVKQLLAQCDGYFRANRLTSGQQGNAVNCYQEVLRRDPSNISAKAGLEQVANRYVIWATAALQRGNASVVESYLARLRQVDSSHPKLATLENKLGKQPATGSSLEKVTRSQFTTGIKAREPVDRLESAIAAQEGLLPLYYFTEIVGMSGETITHLWKYNGSVVSKKSFEIGGSRWRVYSRKNLTPEMTGRWQVIVVDSSGQAIGSSSFTYNTKNTEKDKT